MQTSSIIKALALATFAATSLFAFTPAARAATLFSDLGTSGTIYNTGQGWTISGSSSLTGETIVQANAFVVSGTGPESVSQIDLAVSNDAGANTFSASLYTDSAGLPGTQIAGAHWNLSTTNTGFCCSLVSITGISGITLTGGAEYFLVLSPLSLTDNSWNGLAFNNTGVLGTDAYSTDGTTWVFNGNTPTGAFDILGSPVAATPEPSSLALLATGLSSLGMLARRRSRAA